MAKFLFATWPSIGHVNPGLPIAECFIKKGHEVMWYTSSHFKEKIESTGAVYALF